MQSAMTTPSWNDFKLIKAIADAGGMAGAAASLKVNHSTVFRQLSQVEKALGAPLFERHRSGYVATPAGQEMAALAERMENDILGFTRKLAGHEQTPSGLLRVTTNDVILKHLLMPLIPAYVERYPAVQLEVSQSNQALSLSRRDADIAIRATDDPPENLVGRRIGNLSWALYGNAAEFGMRQTFPDTEELLELNWIGLGENLSDSKPARYLHATLNPQRVVLRLNTVRGLADAIHARVGVAPLPCYMGDGSPDLVRLSNTIPQLETSLWLLTHPDLRNAARVRSFMDYIGTEFARQKSSIAGRS